MKNDELEPHEQVGFALILTGLDLFVNKGRFTKAVLTGLNNSQKEKPDEIK